MDPRTFLQTLIKYVNPLYRKRNEKNVTAQTQLIVVYDVYLDEKNDVTQSEQTMLTVRENVVILAL